MQVKQLDWSQANSGLDLLVAIDGYTSSKDVEASAKKSERRHSTLAICVNYLAYSIVVHYNWQ